MAQVEAHLQAEEKAQEQVQEKGIILVCVFTYCFLCMEYVS
jgi:hypothetical protein